MTRIVEELQRGEWLVREFPKCRVLLTQHVCAEFILCLWKWCTPNHSGFQAIYWNSSCIFFLILRENLWISSVLSVFNSYWSHSVNISLLSQLPFSCRRRWKCFRMWWPFLTFLLIPAILLLIFQHTCKSCTHCASQVPQISVSAVLQDAVEALE